MATTKHFRKRDAILTYLQSTTAHPSAEMVYADLKQQIPDLSLGTVYRNLNLFKDQGLAITVGTVKGVERYDANTDAHVHFICEGCDDVIDLHQMEIPASFTEDVEKFIGCKVGTCNVSFTGTCKVCLENS